MAFGLDSPDRQRAVLFTLLLVGLAYVFWQYLYSPLREERVLTEERLATLQSYNDQARALTQPARLRDLEQREAEYQVRLAEYETLLPAEAEVPTLLEEVAFAAIENDVKIINFAPLPEVAGEVLIEIPYDVQVQGDYHDVGRFLASVVSLPRVVRPTISELLQVEVGAVQGLTTAPQAQAPAADQPAAPTEAAPPPEYEVLATMRLSTYVPSALRMELSTVSEAKPVARSTEEVRDEG
jgi:type IV pilus assembly protein PilO